MSSLFDDSGGDLPDDPALMPSPAAASQRVGEYELLEEIGRGGMGVVFRARDLRLNRVVALKLILTGRLASDLEVKRFHAEAEAAAQLEHPNIVPIYEVGESEGRHFFAMKLMEGGGLAGKVIRESAMSNQSRRTNSGARTTDSLVADYSPKTGAVLMAKIARAVHHAHQHGILHRDLKPGNILLDASGEPMVTDFGLARRLEGGSELTLSGTVVGSPSYMAPEQAAGHSREVTTAADIHSLGAVLFHLLAGRPPFHEDSALATLRALMDREAPRPSALNPQVDRDLETICLKCLEKEPARRYASAAALADDLERWQHGEPILARPTGTPERVWKWLQRHPAWAALAGVSATALGGFIGLQLVNEAKLTHERDQARQQERLAATNELRALAEARRAETNALAARQNLYAADIYVAAQFVEAGQAGPALALLKHHEPAAGQPDLRGFEWRLLRARCEGDPAQVLRGHGREVSTLAFSADGRRMASGDHREIRLWDTGDWRNVAVFPNPDDRANWEAKGQQGLALMKRDPAKVFELMTGRTGLEVEIAPSRPDTAHANWALAFSPDGSLLASAGRDEYVKFWDLNTRRLRNWYPAKHADLGFLANDRVAVLGEVHGKRNEAEIVDPATGQAVRTFEPGATALAVSGDGRRVFTVAGKRDVAVWSASNMVQLARARQPYELTGRMASSADGELLASTAQWDAELAHIWYATDASRNVALPKLGSAIHALAFSPDNQLLALGLRDSTVRLINTTSGKELRRLTGHQAEVLAVGWTQDGQLVSAGRDTTIRVWSAGRFPETGGLNQKLRRLVVARRGGQIAAVNNSGHVVVWDGHAPETRPLNARRGFVPLAFREAEDTLLVASAEKGRPVTVEFWRLADGSTLRAATLGGSEDYGPRLEATPEGGRVILFRKEGAAVFDAMTGREIRRCGEARREFHGPDLVIDANHFLSRTFPIGAAIWDVRTGGPAVTFQFPEGVRPNAFAVSPDGAFVITGDTDSLIRVWDAVSGRLLRQLTGHGATVQSLAVTPDGRTLASCATDRVTKLWSLATGRELMTLNRGYETREMAFLPDGNTLAGFGLTANVRVWTAPVSAWK